MLKPSGPRKALRLKLLNSLRLAERLHLLLMARVRRPVVPIQKPLVVALQFEVQDDSLDPSSVRLDLRRFRPKHAVQLRVVRDLSRLDQARMKLLPAPLSRGPMLLD